MVSCRFFSIPCVMAIVGLSSRAETLSFKWLWEAPHSTGEEKEDARKPLPSPQVLWGLVSLFKNPIFSWAKKFTMVNYELLLLLFSYKFENKNFIWQNAGQKIKKDRNFFKKIRMVVKKYPTGIKSIPFRDKLGFREVGFIIMYLLTIQLCSALVWAD